MSDEKNLKLPDGARLMGEDFYVIADARGNAEFYEKDPIKPENRNSQFNLSRRIFEIMDGPSDIVNPIKMRILLYPVRRGAKFDFNQLRYVREHPEIEVGDLSGNSVELTNRWDTNGAFPYIGIVRDENGQVIGERHYSTNGQCSDGNPDHGLIFIKKSRG